MLILSVIRSKGNYQGNDFDNINFQCFSDTAPKGLLAGSPFETVKVKTDVVIDCLGKSINSIDWEKIVGSEIIPTYNKYGQPVSFVISYADGSGSASIAAEAPQTADDKSSDPAASHQSETKSSKKSA